MFLPAYDAACEPVSNGLRCVARLHLKWLAETLAIIAGILYVACAGSPSPRQGASEPRRCLPCRFPPHGLPRRRVGHALRKPAGYAAPVFLRRPGICHEEEHFEGRMPSLGDLSRARVGVYGSVRTRRRRPAASPAAPTPPCRPVNPKGATFRGRDALGPRGFTRGRALPCTKCTDFAPRPPPVKGHARTNGRRETGQKGFLRSWTRGA